MEVEKVTMKKSPYLVEHSKNPQEAIKLAIKKGLLEKFDIRKKLIEDYLNNNKNILEYISKHTSILLLAQNLIDQEKFKNIRYNLKC